ncbi:thioredoxin [Flavobacterium collinsii]|uniref:thioredoxin family protein n=1 Tax=Flavobacterium collinsii TaxID=1114861 RepID=UPI0022C207A5|nr:thioredoxin family protein [Flavobacterium collinsii]GIQ61246.1 thioredoxin [Flavobacterium collinsii]
MSLSDMIKSEKPTLVNFHATWCGPCHMMKPNLDEVVEKVGDKISYERIDIDENRGLAELFQVRSIPTTIILKNGEVKWRQTGIFPLSEITRLINENL